MKKIINFIAVVLKFLLHRKSKTDKQIESLQIEANLLRSKIDTLHEKRTQLEVEFIVRNYLKRNALVIHDQCKLDYLKIVYLLINDIETRIFKFQNINFEMNIPRKEVSKNG